MSQLSDFIAPAPGTAQALCRESIRSNGKQLLSLEEAMTLLPKHVTDQTREAYQQALDDGNLSKAACIASSSTAVLAVEIEPELLGNLFEQKGDVVVVSGSDHGSTTGALDK